MNEVTLTQILAWIVAANTIITFATTFYNLMSTRATKALKAIEAVQANIGALSAERQKASEAAGERFQKMEGRLLRIEADMEHMPSREQSQQLALSIERMSGQIAAMDAKLSGRIDTLAKSIDPVSSIADRWQELILEQAKK